MKRTRIIAEIGVNHNGSLEQALRLIDACANAGADVVKFQTFSAERLASRDAPKADYQIKQDGKGSQVEMLKRYELSYEDHKILLNHCSKRRVQFLSTGFDEIDIEMLVKLGIREIKIPSGEITNLPYLRAVSSHKLPILMSTGMSTLEEVEQAVSVLFNEGSRKSDLTILHCTSSYPALDEDLNLNAMVAMQRYFDVAVGYSDHSLGIEASIIAASMGAEVIEKHVTLNRSSPGPDHQSSVEPKELKELVRIIRRKDIMVGSPIKAPSYAELSTAVVARKSIVAKKDIKKGELLTADNITSKRPATGLSPMLWDDVINTFAVKNFKADEHISIKTNNND